MQIDQLFEFVYILIDKKQVTAGEMAKHFGISTRTVYRWMEALSISGVPVYSTKGRGGGIAISEKYTLDKTLLSEEEKLAIVSSVKALNALTSNGETANSAIKTLEKISGFTKTDTDWLEVDFEPWSSEGNEVSKIFGTLREGILTKKQISFDYYSGDGRIESRVVHPWKLVYKGQSWYLYGWCTSRNSERFFKLTRMRNLILTSRNATISQDSINSKKSFEKPDAGKLSYSQQKPSLIKITAKISSPKIPYLLDAFICSEVIPQDEGSVIAAFSIPDFEWIYERLLGFGADIKILSPESVKEKMIKQAESVLKIYGYHSQD